MMPEVNVVAFERLGGVSVDPVARKKIVNTISCRSRVWEKLRRLLYRELYALRAILCIGQGARFDHLWFVASVGAYSKLKHKCPV